MTEPAFVGAGKVEGKELWRIEDLKPVKQPKVSNSIKELVYLVLEVINIQYSTCNID